MYFCEDLDDGEWHTLHIKRRAENVRMWVDDCTPRESEYSTLEIRGGTGTGNSCSAVVMSTLCLTQHAQIKKKKAVQFVYHQ